MLSSSQRNAVEVLIKEVGLNCIAPYFRNLKDGDVRFKQSHFDPVSVADEEAEMLLEAGLNLILPGALFVGEESYAKDPGILARLNSFDPVWVVDPIDGTSNFVKGQDGFGIMVALVQDNRVLSSWFFEICSQTLTVCHAGEGVTINGQPATAPLPSHPQITGYLGWKLLKFPKVIELTETLTGFKLLPVLDPSIVSYFKILTGQLDFLLYRLTYPWDHLPGIAMLKEVGGLSSRWDGEPLQFTDTTQGLIIARSPEVMDRVRAELVAPLLDIPEIRNMGK